jgi:hypothetical protein
LAIFVFAFVCVAFEVTNVGDISDVPDLKAEVPEVSGNDIECQERADITEVDFIINGWAANVHTDVAGYDGLKRLFFS